jgi:hypothetical protein
MHGPTRTAPALRELRLAPWQAPESRPVLLGSLRAVLGDFTAERPVAVVPAQRTSPDLTTRSGH